MESNDGSLNPEELPDLSIMSRSTFVASLAAMTDQHMAMLVECTNNDKAPIDAVRHLVAAALRRSASLVQGFLSMADQGNRFCAVPLIRLQIDSAMRVHACRLVSDPSSFVLFILDGGEPSKYPDRGSLQLRDAPLHAALEVLYPMTSDLYRETNGFVHLSNHHLFGILDWDKLKKEKLSVTDHALLPQWPEEQLRGDAVAMLWATHVLTEECQQLLSKYPRS